MNRSSHHTRESEGQSPELSAVSRTLPIALLQAREAVMERFRPVLNAHDVTEQQWRVMRVLDEVTELDATALASRATLLPPSLTRILRALEQRGFVQSKKDPADGRRALTALTEAGRSFLRQVAPQSAAVYQEIEARLGSARISHLLDELNFMLARLNDD